MRPPSAPGPIRPPRRTCGKLSIFRQIFTIETTLELGRIPVFYPSASIFNPSEKSKWCRFRSCRHELIGVPVGHRSLCKNAPSPLSLCTCRSSPCASMNKKERTAAFPKAGRSAAHACGFQVNSLGEKDPYFKHLYGELP